MALLTLAEAKAQLDIETSTHDDELQAYVDALTSVIEHYTGPVEERQVTETIEGRGGTMCLSQVPAIALLSITPALTDGDPVDLAAVVLDSAVGVVRHRSGSFAGTVWVVTYTAGRGTVPATVNLAARILLQHLWRTQNGAARGVGTADDFSVTEPIPGFGYAVPNRVLQLLEPFKLPPGVA
ncbi:phage gp6-like head-tail connector protein [Streptomyces sp. NBC_01775]|uniref:head-tail connector protein n=1 Tax=Streptomyces sp. NBC_01775 TaxID=2975939 RepID=UPI002DDC603B|nr:head-tail connector protein [Streptomyces sp. NBC_01775]WSB78328.1 phage gp6-like head-tail connector protein [Streptomyces sp. NBC_01775]